MILSSKVDVINIPLRKRKIFWLTLLLLAFLSFGFIFKNQITNLAYNYIIIRTYIKSLGIGGVDRNLNPVSILKDFSVNITDKFKQIEKF